MSLFKLFIIFSVVIFAIYVIGLIVHDTIKYREIKTAKNKDPNFLTFDKFCDWANDRACDGQWSFNISTQAIAIINDVNSKRKKEQEKYWEETYQVEVEQSLIRIYGKDYMNM